MRFHFRIQTAFLGHISEPESVRVGHLVVVPGDASAVGAKQPEDGPHRGCLAGSVRSEKPQHSAAINRQGAACEGVNVAKRLVEILDNQHEDERLGERPDWLDSNPDRMTHDGFNRGVELVLCKRFG